MNNKEKANLLTVSIWSSLSMLNLLSISFFFFFMIFFNAFTISAQVKVDISYNENENLQVIDINTGVTKYRFAYKHPLILVQKDEARPLSNAFCMIRPAQANWSSCDSFFDLLIDGVSVCMNKAEISGFGSGRENGGFKIKWDSPKAIVTVCFTAESLRNWLLVQVSVRAKTPIKTFIVYLRCYPNSYAGDWKMGRKLRERHIVTAKGNYIANNHETQNIVLTNAEPWIVYYDAAFDLGENRILPNGKKCIGHGPCAMAYMPEETTKAIIKLGNYAIDTKLFYLGDKRDIHLMLWDFGLGASAKKNSEAIKYFKNLKIENH
jgi:hypothetical protein